VSVRDASGGEDQHSLLVLLDAIGRGFGLVAFAALRQRLVHGRHRVERVTRER
jgi:hypothetical protein